MKKLSPLQTKRFYKVKKPSREFLCALCSAPRALKYSRYLSFTNYLQILLLSAFLIWLLFPYMGAKAIVITLPVWISFEFIHKLLYRRELSCPYCGFDPTWYRRDVNFAKAKVQEFWNKNYPDLVNKEEVSIPNQPIMNPSQPEVSEVSQNL